VSRVGYSPHSTVQPPVREDTGCGVPGHSARRALALSLTPTHCRQSRCRNQPSHVSWSDQQAHSGNEIKRRLITAESFGPAGCKGQTNSASIEYQSHIIELMRVHSPGGSPRPTASYSIRLEPVTHGSAAEGRLAWPLVLFALRHHHSHAANGGRDLTVPLCAIRMEWAVLLHTPPQCLYSNSQRRTWACTVHGTATFAALHHIIGWP
jgi:hypothetical protein